MKDNVGNILEKIFEKFPFQILISCLVGGIVYFITPKNSLLLEKFGAIWYCVLVSLVAFLIISFIVWIFKQIKSKKEKKKEIDKIFEILKDELYSVTNKLDDKAIKLLRRLVETNNEPIQIIGRCSESQYSLLRLDLIESKNGELVEVEYEQDGKMCKGKTQSKIYWLNEKAFKWCQLVLYKYGKLSKFDNEKGEE